MVFYDGFSFTFLADLQGRSEHVSRALASGRGSKSAAVRMRENSSCGTPQEALRYLLAAQDMGYAACIAKPRDWQMSTDKLLSIAEPCEAKMRHLIRDLRSAVNGHAGRVSAIRRGVSGVEKSGDAVRDGVRKAIENTHAGERCCGNDTGYYAGDRVSHAVNAGSCKVTHKNGENEHTMVVGVQGVEPDNTGGKGNVLLFGTPVSRGLMLRGTGDNASGNASKSASGSNSLFAAIDEENTVPFASALTVVPGSDRQIDGSIISRANVTRMVSGYVRDVMSQGVSVPLPVDGSGVPGGDAMPGKTGKKSVSKNSMGGMPKKPRNIENKRDKNLSMQADAAREKSRDMALTRYEVRDMIESHAVLRKRASEAVRTLGELIAGGVLYYRYLRLLQYRDDALPVHHEMVAIAQEIVLRCVDILARPERGEEVLRGMQGREVVDNIVHGYRGRRMPVRVNVKPGERVCRVQENMMQVWAGHLDDGGRNEVLKAEAEPVPFVPPVRPGKGGNDDRGDDYPDDAALTTLTIAAWDISAEPGCFLRAPLSCLAGDEIAQNDEAPHSLNVYVKASTDTCYCGGKSDQFSSSKTYVTVRWFTGDITPVDGGLTTLLPGESGATEVRVRDWRDALQIVAAMRAGKPWYELHREQHSGSLALAQGEGNGAVMSRQGAGIRRKKDSPGMRTDIPSDMSVEAWRAEVEELDIIDKS
tara:strand:- start:16127 stop:18232 length:2106 start_codon:yes stop_codon:yes gene_type:complete